MSLSHSLRSIRRTLLLVCIFAGFGNIFAGQYYFNPQIVCDSSVVCGRLDNGISYYVIPNPYSGAKIDLYMMVASGSADENETQSGYAHLLEHLLFESKDKNNSSIHKRLSALGKTIGKGYNANTNFDVTRFDIYDIERDDIAMITALAGLVIALMLVINQISALFDSVSRIFGLY